MRQKAVKVFVEQKVFPDSSYFYNMKTVLPVEKYAI